MNSKIKVIFALITGMFWVLVALPAQAIPIGFQNITNNNATNAANGEAQLSMDVNPVAGSDNQVSFTFTNTGPAASSITDIYFDDGTLLGIASISNGPGVSFSQGANPGNLPGGNTVGFQTTAGFLADSDSPVQPNGVNPGEQVTIVFNLKSGQTYADVLSELNSGELRIGIHVQGFANGGSESFINVPEPSTLLLLGAGLVGLGLLGRRRFKTKP